MKFKNQGTVYISADNKDGQAIVSVKDSGTELTLKLCQGFLQSSRVNPRQELVLDYSYLKALAKHTVVQFGLKTIRIVKVQCLALGCL